jgi:hypothetical protein
MAGHTTGVTGLGLKALPMGSGSMAGWMGLGLRGALSGLEWMALPNAREKSVRKGAPLKGDPPGYCDPLRHWSVPEWRAKLPGRQKMGWKQAFLLVTHSRSGRAFPPEFLGGGTGC